jgi:DNA repair exonuclease SbcCD nuclease subunit
MVMIPRLKKSEVAIISDLHLGVHSNSSTWHTIAIEWANWLRDELVSKNIKDIIFCGDWHHSRSEISVLTLQVSADIFDILADFNIICITGNHDIYFKHRTDVNSMSVFKKRKNVTVLDKPYVHEQFDKTILFCPWNTDITKLPKGDVLFGHLETETFKMNTFKTCSEGIKVSDVLDVCPLAISGHFHTRQEKIYKNGRILYVGNTFQMDFGDTNNDKGYYIMDLNDLSTEFFKNTVSPIYRKTSLSELISFGSFTKKVKEIFGGNIVQLKIDKNIAADDMDILLKKISLLHPETLTVDYDINFNKISNLEGREDLSGIDAKEAIVEFIDLLDIDDKDGIIKYTIELYKKCKQL